MAVRAYVTVFGSGGSSQQSDATDLTGANTEETVDSWTDFTNYRLELKVPQFLYLFWFEVDGQMLTTATPDTVKDTPMLNYAVLELSSFSNGSGLYNGNLLGQGSNIDAYSAVGAVKH